MAKYVNMTKAGIDFVWNFCIEQLKYVRVGVWYPKGEFVSKLLPMIIKLDSSLLVHLHCFYCMLVTIDRFSGNGTVGTIKYQIYL